jgi:hypothetical protein
LGRFLKYDIHSLIHTENCWTSELLLDILSLPWQNSTSEF